jgi:hypothetical protein
MLGTRLPVDLQDKAFPIAQKGGRIGEVETYNPIASKSQRGLFRGQGIAGHLPACNDPEVSAQHQAPLRHHHAPLMR